MEEQAKQEMGQKVFGVLCRYMDNHELQYDKNEEEKLISLDFEGEDFPVKISLVVDATRQLIRVFSMLPFQMSEKKRIDGAIALSAINYGLVDGCFDYDLGDGKIAFRMAARYCNDVIDAELITYLLGITINTVEEYNDKLFGLNKEMLSLEDILKIIRA